MRTIFTFIAAVSILMFSFSSCKTTKQKDHSQDIVFQGKSFDEYLKSGDRKIKSRNYKGALEDFNKAADMDPFSPDIYNYRGIAKYYLEDYSGALIDFNKAIELQPDYAEAYNLRGVIKGELNDNEGACADWEKAFELGFKHAFTLLKKFCNEYQ